MKLGLLHHPQPKISINGLVHLFSCLLNSIIEDGLDTPITNHYYLFLGHSSAWVELELSMMQGNLKFKFCMVIYASDSMRS
jgi:hypothetical protein